MKKIIILALIIGAFFLGYFVWQTFLKRPVYATRFVQVEEYKNVLVYKNCDNTYDITISTNTNRTWRINNVEKWIGGYSQGASETWNNVSFPYTIQWWHENSQQWKTIDEQTDGYNFEFSFEECKRIEPTPTPEPREADPWDCSMDNSCKGEPSAPTCADQSPVELPENAHVIRTGTQATIKAHIPEGNQVNIYYRENSENDWTHAVGNVKVEGKFLEYTINDLDANLGYTFGIQAANTCAGGDIIIAVIVDPPANGEIFPVTYWIVNGEIVL